MRAAMCAVLCALAGCGTDELVLADIIPASAFIDDMNRVDVGFIGGVGIGGGAMIITDINGATFRVPVKTNGTALGAILMASASDARLDLDLADAQLTSADGLFGAYEGSRAEIMVLLGAGYLDLENEHHVGLSGWLGGGGVSTWIGHQWLFVEASGAPVASP